MQTITFFLLKSRTEGKARKRRTWIGSSGKENLPKRLQLNDLEEKVR